MPWLTSHTFCCGNRLHCATGSADQKRSLFRHVQRPQHRASQRIHTFGSRHLQFKRFVHRPKSDRTTTPEPRPDAIALKRHGLHDDALTVRALPLGQTECAQAITCGCKVDQSAIGGEVDLVCARAKSVHTRRPQRARATTRRMKPALASCRQVDAQDSVTPESDPERARSIFVDGRGCHFGAQQFARLQIQHAEFPGTFLPPVDARGCGQPETGAMRTQ